MWINFWNWFIKITGWPLQKICFRTRIYYENKTVQNRNIKGPAIIVSNHTSVFDYVVWMFVFWKRTARFQMAELLFKKPVLGTLLKWVGGIYVDRKSNNFNFIIESEKILRKGGIVGVFPESRIPLPEEERPLKFTPSAAYLALAANVPIIPVYTDGSYFNKKHANVIIGCPIDVTSLVDENETEKETLSRISNELRNKIIALGKKLDENVSDLTNNQPNNYIFYDFCKATAALPGLLWYRPKYVYENDNAKKHIKGGALLVSNHNGYGDPVQLQIAVWYRRHHFVCSIEFVLSKIAWLFNQFHCIPVDRDNFSMNSFNKIIDYLKEGKLVSMFPEGHINVSEETVDMFKSGVILMSIKGNAPILPIFITKRKNVFERLRVAIGEPINISKIYGENPTFSQIREMTTQLQEKELMLSKL